MDKQLFNPFNPSDQERESKYRERRGLRFVIAGIVNAWIAYFIAKLPRLTFHLNGDVVTYNRADAPALFNGATAVAIVIAVLFLFIGIRLLISDRQTKAETSKDIPASTRHGFLWGTFNMVLVLLVTYLGYTGLTAERLRGANPDWILCIAAFFVVMLVPISRPHFAAVSTLRKPEWGRCPFRWARDPLQSLFIESFWLAGFVIGQVVRFFASNLRSDNTAKWTVFVYVAVFAGWVAGQVVAYAIYRNRIEA